MVTPEVVGHIDPGVVGIVGLKTNGKPGDRRPDRDGQLSTIGRISKPRVSR
jgi:hypothetical protein